MTRLPRPAARILLVDAVGRTLMFRFTPDDRPPFWCTPGGAVDPGESYEQAARRQVEFLTIEGVEVEADERYFRVDIDAHEVNGAGHTALEQRVMQSWRWFTRDELAAHTEPYFPTDLIELLDATEPAPTEQPHV